MLRRRAWHWYSALGSGFGSRHGVFLLSFVYKSIVFPLFGSTDNSSSSLLLHHLLVSTSLIAPGKLYLKMYIPRTGKYFILLF